MFLIKKILAPLFMPLSAVLLLALVGLFCLWFTRKQRTGKVLVTVAVGLLGLLSYDQVSGLLAGPLEGKYPPIMSTESVQGVKWVVVLGGGSEVDPRLPPSTYLSDASLIRLLEGVSLHKGISGEQADRDRAKFVRGYYAVAQVMHEYLGMVWAWLRGQI